MIGRSVLCTCIVGAIALPAGASAATPAGSGTSVLTLQTAALGVQGITTSAVAPAKARGSKFTFPVATATVGKAATLRHRGGLRLRAGTRSVTLSAPQLRLAKDSRLTAKIGKSTVTVLHGRRRQAQAQRHRGHRRAARREGPADRRGRRGAAPRAEARPPGTRRARHADRRRQARHGHLDDRQPGPAARRPERRRPGAAPRPVAGPRPRRAARPPTSAARRRSPVRPPRSTSLPRRSRGTCATRSSSTSTPARAPRSPAAPPPMPPTVTARQQRAAGL